MVDIDHVPMPVYLILGSNINEPSRQITEALTHIEHHCGPIISKSGIYQTQAWGKLQQPDFLNQVICIRTFLNPFGLLSVLNLIESQMGRIRKEKWEPRVIDIDILYYDQVCLQTPKLRIPHPHIHSRRFVLLPLCELIPDFIHPELEQTNAQLLVCCPDNLQVSKL